MIDYFPTRLIPIARRWWTQNGSISRNYVYNMAQQAGVSLQEMEAAIAYMLDHEKETCQQCKGHGYHEATIQNRGTLDWRSAIVPCDHPTCKDGKIQPT